MGKAIADNLPSGVGTIAIAVGVYTIAIKWDDDRDGDNTNNITFTNVAKADIAGAIYRPMQSNEPQQHQNSSINRHQTGMTLIEIMIALLIGAFLLGGVLQIFIGSKQTYRMQEALSRLQENGRFAIDFIGQDIRMTSYWGCHSGARAPDIDIAGENDRCR